MSDENDKPKSDDGPGCGWWVITGIIALTAIRIVEVLAR